ncbi:MAG: glycosyltransferase family 2 protein [Chryseobacterium sp.]|jgi:glycosyltransferase involved in cell wall biosynthesis|uniref:glycosyltransferase family 2 protein n=1 Tax=Chryseobacterium sp. TaxID=1871047 RepID=UPI002834DBA4|nr:glycosyltransferase family 2 protein [Chryseobacterium sp.]MDR2236268.1 glycosyltransferase family 2 protein [Chryseobacterium sp.]
MMNISVIIPVYNAAEFLEKAVGSALQFDEVKEIILVEDRSTDESLTIGRNLSAENPRVKLFQHPNGENRGAGASRNLGIDMASEEYIAFLDADDFYLPNRFEAEKEIFKDPKTEGVFGAIGTEYLTEKGKNEFQSKFKEVSLSTVNYPAEGEEVFRGLLSLSPKTFGTSFHLNSLTVRRASLNRQKLRFKETLRVHQDSEFIIRLAYHCYLKTGIIDQAIAMRGIHDNNRITKIIRYTPEYNQRKQLYWNALHQWAVTQNLPGEYKKRIYLIYKSFDLSLKMGLSKYAHILLEILKNPEILRTQYRFTYYHR